jgi:S-adenosylmethionine:tRNA ribosyltransferase-isomerase
VDASELDFELPPALIAQAPLPERDGARMLVLDRESGAVSHRQVTRLPQAIRPALFVVNDTRVIPARLFATKPTGGKVELLLIERLEGRTTDGGEVETWAALGRGTKSLRLKMQLSVDGAPMTATVRSMRDGGELELELSAPDVRQAIESAGHIPLPPYIRRDVEAADRERYQTVFAAAEGSVAAPTAGLHFTSGLLSAMGQAGHQVAKITLHVGPGTFAPLRSEHLDEHRMHPESFVIPEETAQAIAAAKRDGRPVVAVGTTVCRTLESAAEGDGVRAGSGRTAIFIKPPHTFRVIDALFTNFHLPRSTLLALVMAFGGVENVRAAYAAAVREQYRFFSYGDAMLVRSGAHAGKDAS